MPRLLLLLATLLVCAAFTGAATRDQDAFPHAKTSLSRFGRKLKQTDAVCCLFGGNNNPPACNQQDVNSPDARNTSQSGLVNVNGVYVNVGCIQVVANVQACVTVGTLIGNGQCIRRDAQLTPQAQQTVNQATQAVQGVAQSNGLTLLAPSDLLPARGQRAQPTPVATSQPASTTQATPTQTAPAGTGTTPGPITSAATSQPAPADSTAPTEPAGTTAATDTTAPAGTAIDSIATDATSTTP